ncbi:MAG: NAD-dependent epimerase/dehydratase family protein [Pseudomonadales bacterium]|nr:NAD-dependent epimerase/dehydratase family protein [Pseudomonadales bacterium]
MKILVTGATGFIGSALCQYLQAAGHQVHGLIRSKSSLSIPTIQIDDLNQIANKHLKGMDAVVHTAGLAHLSNVDPAQYQVVNVDASVKLLQTCIAVGVPRMITLSSTKAVGEGSVGPRTKINPVTPYGKSKREAERKLEEIQSTSSIELLQLRIPLIIGQGVKGNFRRLIDVTGKGWPLPMSALSAKRHYLTIGNLLDFIEHRMVSDALKSDCLFLADEEAVSLGEVLRALSIAQGANAFNIPMPKWFLNQGSRLFLSAKNHEQIFQACLVDSSETYKISNWKQKYTTIEGIYQMFGKSH